MLSCFKRPMAKSILKTYHPMMTISHFYVQSVNSAMSSQCQGVLHRFYASVAVESLKLSTVSMRHMLAAEKKSLSSSTQHCWDICSQNLVDPLKDLKSICATMGIYHQIRLRCIEFFNSSSMYLTLRLSLRRIFRTEHQSYVPNIEDEIIKCYLQCSNIYIQS